MKRASIISGVVVAAGLVALATWLLLEIHWQTPESLLDDLAEGRGDPGKIIMRLNVARGDAVGPAIRAVQDAARPAKFRAAVLELLFKWNRRSSQPKIERAILEATGDPEPLVRRMAAEGIATYGSDEFQVHLTEMVFDPDQRVRRQAYAVLAADAKGRPPTVGVWEVLCEKQHEPARARLVEHCLKQMKEEKDPELRLLARAVVSREMETMAETANQALQASEVTKAEDLLRRALAMDPKNAQLQTRLARFLLAHGDKQEALRFARSYGALIEVPRLSAAPKIDGDPTDNVWDEAYKAETFYRTSGRWVAVPAEGKSAAFLGHRDGVLYLAVLGYEKDLGRLAKRYTEHDSNVWMDDCVELVFDPGMTVRDTYKFVINPAGGLMDKFRDDRGQNFECRYKARIFHDRGYWACEFAVDGKVLGDHPVRAGDIWSINLFRVRVGPASEHCAIWPPFGWVDRPELYPIVLFK